MGDGKATEGDIVEVCTDLLQAAGIKYILLIEPTPELQDLLEWAWCRIVDGEQSCSFPTAALH